MYSSDPWRAPEHDYWRGWRASQDATRWRTGGREGLFIPEAPIGAGPLLLCEGPTDTAALLDLGFSAIGRPSCTGGVRFCCELARGRAAVVVADADEPGRRGAEALASTLRLYCPSVRIIWPRAGVKDAREWVRRGARRADLLAVIEAAPISRLHVRNASGVRARDAVRKGDCCESR